MVKQSKLNQIILLIMDDVKSSQFFELLDNGKLPNFKNLTENGLYSKNCITSFPSVTFPCYPNIVTGAYSGYFPEEGSGIPAYHWISRTDPPSEGKKPPFIRNYSIGTHVWKIGKDLGKNVKTIFEQAGEGNFFSSLNIIFRGSYFSPPSKFNTENVFKNIQNAFKEPKKFFSTKEPPIITVGYIPKTDELLHERGYDHPEYIKEILKCDEYLGNLVKFLKSEGHYDDTAIAVISDHGNYKAEKLYDLEPFFKSNGLIPYDPKKGKGDFDANFGSVGSFNFPGKSWQHHPTIEEMEKFKTSGNHKSINLFNVLWKIPGVKLMYYRDDKNSPERGKIYINKKNSKTGETLTGIIEYKGFGPNLKTKYSSDDLDIFGYNNQEKDKEHLDGKFHDIDEWLSKTYEIDFPIIIDQIPRFFKNPRSSDILISTLGEYAFNYEHGKTMNKHLYSHDIALRKSMNVPFIIGGSDSIPNKEIQYCKTTDMVPTMLDLLAIQPHESVVGKTLLT
ncbi:MAG: alkaline phosphatase family protein [Promethearchaeati archaeon]